MDEFEKESIEYYIKRLQSILSESIADSYEFKRLKELLNTHSENDIQLCVFSVLMDRKTINVLKHLNFSQFQELVKTFAQEAQLNPSKPAPKPPPLLEKKLSETDRAFLKALKINLS